ncbi:hypothetical protein [Jiulongibacter sp. NS-SX5]|uniref:hypothetical protein n=1 Tax=Jiulongibacter sp. NS-SX5 TaxID=3463854 RepID=UPI004058D28C
MDQITDNLTSIEWWLSSIFLGVLLNVFSSFIKDFIDKTYRNASQRLSRRSEKERAKIIQIVKEAIEYPNGLSVLTYQANRYMLLAVLFGVISLSFTIPLFRDDLLIYISSFVLWLITMCICIIYLQKSHRYDLAVKVFIDNYSIVLKDPTESDSEYTE